MANGIEPSDETYYDVNGDQIGGSYKANLDSWRKEAGRKAQQGPGGMHDEPDETSSRGWQEDGTFSAGDLERQCHGHALHTSDDSFGEEPPWQSEEPMAWKGSTVVESYDNIGRFVAAHAPFGDMKKVYDAPPLPEGCENTKAYLWKAIESMMTGSPAVVGNGVYRAHVEACLTRWLRANHEALKRIDEWRESEISRSVGVMNEEYITGGMKRQVSGSRSKRLLATPATMKAVSLVPARVHGKFSTCTVQPVYSFFWLTCSDAIYKHRENTRVQRYYTSATRPRRPFGLLPQYVLAAVRRVTPQEERIHTAFQPTCSSAACCFKT